MIRKLHLIILVVVTTAALTAMVATPAQAVQIRGVYAPEDHGAYVKGWANITTDCPYYQCYVYLKIERNSWLGPRFVNGNWVNWSNPWVSMSASKLSGCHNYRSTLEIYSDSIGPVGGGVNVGYVGISASGQRIYRYKVTWSSGWVRRCR